VLIAQNSGGNLASILAIKAKYSEEPIPIVFQLLIVPVTDNTASTETRWASNRDTVWLSPDRMNWFKHNYLPSEDDWSKWDVSPIFATREMLEGLPPAWIAVAELDILSDEGIAFGERLREAGVATEIEVYKGAPHPIMAMDGKLSLFDKI
jgi:acetyl esterase/lipase